MILAFNNKILSAGTKLLGNDSSPTPVVDDELLISTDTVTTAASRSGGIIWYSNSSPITYSGNNRYVVHKITLSNAHSVTYNNGTTDEKQGQIQQQIFWDRPTGEPGSYSTMLAIANIVNIDYAGYICGGRTSSGSNPRYAYTDWTRAYDVQMFNNDNPVIFRFIVDRDTNKVNVYCTRVGPYATNERLIYDANMVVDGTNSMLKSPSSISPYSRTADDSSGATIVYADAKYEMHACSSFDVAIAC